MADSAVSTAAASSPALSKEGGATFEGASAVPQSFTFNHAEHRSLEPTKKDLFVFSWLCHLDSDLRSCGSKENLRTVQLQLEQQLLKLLTPANQYAKPTRPIRRLVARCFVAIHQRGDSRTLFDTVTTLQKELAAVLSSKDKEKDRESKLGLLHCLGTLSEAFGASFLSLCAETLGLSYKVMKSSDYSALRIEAISVCACTLRTAGKAAPESTLKDILKFVKAGLQDSRPLVRIACAECMQALVTSTTMLVPFGNKTIEEYLALAFKAATGEGANFAVRRAIASLVATILCSTQTNFEPSSSVNASSRKTAKQGSGGDPSAPAFEAPATSTMPVKDMLHSLSSVYTSKSSSRETRAAVAETYAALFLQLGRAFVEQRYGVIIRHLLTDLAPISAHNSNKSSFATTRHEALATRLLVGHIIRERIGRRLLSEQGQLEAVRFLVDFLRSSPPSSASDAAQSEFALVIAVQEIGGLLLDLGSAAIILQDAVVDPLVRLIVHSSVSVQLSACWALQCLVLALPSQIPSLVPLALDQFNKSVPASSSASSSALIAPEQHARSLGQTYALASIVSASSTGLLYVNFETTARCFALAGQLLKTAAAEKDPTTVSVQTQMAWATLSALMRMGSHFVKLHLPQLLLLVKSALPKPTAGQPQRSETEWAHLLWQREATLSWLLTFLAHNRELVTSNVAKRIALLLGNALALLQSVPAHLVQQCAVQPVVAPSSPYAILTVRLLDRLDLFRKRLFQCFAAVYPATAYETSHATLLKVTMDTFADPEKHFVVPPHHSGGSSPSSSLAASSAMGDATLVWSAADCAGYGVTGLLEGLRCHAGATTSSDDVVRLSALAGVPSLSVEDTGEKWSLETKRIETQLAQPFFGVVENDPLALYGLNPLPSTSVDLRFSLPQPLPPATACVDAAIELFAIIFPLQSSPLQEAMSHQLAKLSKHPRFEKLPPGRKAALHVNVVVSIACTLKNAKAAKFFDGQKCGDNAATPGIPPGRATDLVTEVVNAGIVSPDPYLRNVASNTMGTLTKIAGAQVMTAELQTLVDQVVKNTDPNARAGCAVALGSVLSAAGGMASSAHLRTIVQILHSLSSDPHPVVHMWALHALSATVYGAGLMFSPFVNLTVDLIAKLFLSETHEPGGGASANIQAGMGLSEVYQSFGRIISGIIGTLGPELQHQCQVRDVCLNIAEELKYESEQFVVVEALRCTQSFIMFSPAAINVNVLVPFLQRQLGSRHNQIKRASVTCLYQLVQRDPAAVLMAVPQGLEEQLFAMLDTDPYVDEVKSVITGLLRRTAVIAPSRSIDLCRKVLTKASATEMTATAEVAQSGIGSRSRGAPGAYSDEDRDDFDGAPGKVAGVPAAGGQPPAAGSAANPPRWRTQIFALNCLRELIRVIRDEPNPFPEHFDFGLARSRRRAGASTDYLVLRLPDLIKMAFTAATNQVIHMRLEGLQLLKTVIVAFGGLRDPDFEEVSLMEQYHAQVSAAIAATFTDTLPIVVAEAVELCGTYVSSGIVKDISTMSRVLKLLAAALENCKGDLPTAQQGDADTTPHAAIVVNLSILVAWSELYSNTIKHAYLADIVRPKIPLLSVLWVNSLLDYARVRLDPDLVSVRHGGGVNGAESSGLDSMYAASMKEIVHDYYQKAWLPILRSVARLAEENDPALSKALKSLGGPPDVCDRSGEDAPSFYILFGICVEALSATSSATGSPHDAEIINTCTNAMLGLVRPAVAGPFFLEKAAFLELTNVFSRLLQTEGPATQMTVVQIIGCIVDQYGAEYLFDDFEPSSSNHGVPAKDWFPPTSKAYNIMKLLLNVCTPHIPTWSSNSLTQCSGERRGPEHQGHFVPIATEVMANIVRAAPVQCRVALTSIALYIISSVMCDERVCADTATRMLANLKSLLETVETYPADDSSDPLSRALHSTMLYLLEKASANRPGWTAQQAPVVKTALLALAVIVNTAPAFSHFEDTHELFVHTIRSAINSDVTQIAIAGLQSARTIFVLVSKPHAKCKSVGAAYIRALVPDVVMYVTRFQGPQTEGKDVAVAEEAIRTLTAMGVVAGEEERTVVLALVVPVLIQLLDPHPDGRRPSAIHNAALATLLSLAGQSPDPFRRVAAALHERPRGVLETALRANVAANQNGFFERAGGGAARAAENGAGGGELPSIRLKTFASFA